MAVIVVATACFPAVAQSGLQPVRLQLKWRHQFQFAGFYAALEQGYFRDEKLDVTILEGGPSIDPVAVVTSGGADFGIGNSALVVERARGRPVVAVGVIFQHSPFVLLGRRVEGMDNVHALRGRTLGLETHAYELLAYLALERVPLDSLSIVAHPGSVQALVDGTVDALTAYTTTEPYDLKAQGVPYQVFNPRASGIDFYGHTLFTTDAVARRSPEVVRAMRRAMVRGWRYVLDHPDAAMELVRTRYAPDMAAEKLAFEAAEIRRLMLADMVEAGYMHAGRWRHIADGFAVAGLMPAGYPLDGFLFASDGRPDLRWVYGVLGGMSLALAAAFLVAARFHALNRALRAEMAERSRLEVELRRLASTDSLTDVLNRRRFLEVAAETVAGGGASSSLLVLDIDHFKRINDGFGHAAGDRALIAFAATCRAALGEEGVFGRLGGEEFAILLPGRGERAALDTAEAVRRRIEGITVAGSVGLSLSVSIGVAELLPGPSPSEAVDTAFAHADEALYAAKRKGRNQVCGHTRAL